jgi:chemotaxis protein histidine kinase CheA
MAADTADDFQKELVDLFVEEAHEWLQNLHVALDELEQGPAPERRGELIEMMLAGVTNLGESAATINLRDIMDACLAAFPLIEVLKDPRKASSVQEFFAVCRQLGQIQTALTLATSLSPEGDRSSADGAAVSAGLSPGTFVLALQGLLENQSSGIASGRNHIRNLIEQMEKQVQAGVERIDVAVIHEYLARVAEAEESFLKAIDERVPEIFRKVNALKMDGEEPGTLKTALETSLQDVACLREEAQQVNAGSAVLFLTGLHSLLTVVAQRRVHLAATRVESVKARLHVMGEAVRQWVEHGRAQRAAIGQLLPVSHS